MIKCSTCGKEIHSKTDVKLGGRMGPGGGRVGEFYVYPFCKACYEKSFVAKLMDSSIEPTNYTMQKVENYFIVGLLIALDSAVLIYNLFLYPSHDTPVKSLGYLVLMIAMSAALLFFPVHNLRLIRKAERLPES